MPDSRKDPLPAARFVLEIDGIKAAGFTECGGLVVETEVEERHEGGRNNQVHRFPRGIRYGNIVLRRGLSDSDDLWLWHQDIVAGKADQVKNVSIVLLDSMGDEKWRWNLTRAFPVKWAGPEMKSDSNAVAIETLELAHHGISRD